MVFYCEEDKEQFHNVSDSCRNQTVPMLREYRIRIPSLHEKLLYAQSRPRRLLDFLKASPSMEWFKKLKLISPLQVFRRTINGREEISISVPSPVGISRGFRSHFIRKIDWNTFFNICKKWLKNPMNIAILIWLLCVAASATMLGLLVLGVLNEAFPTTASRKSWIEINNQVLNALFTIMSLYQHPSIFYHLFLVCRWRSEDIIELRKLYCKNGSYRPHEWAHMMVVVVLFNITCFAQYFLCDLYWGYSSTQRSEFAESFFFILGTAAPVFAGVYMVYSPLGREYNSDSDEESQGKFSDSDAKKLKKPGLKLYQRRVVVNTPEWVGGLFDCSDDITVGYLSFCCTFCVFGWNMERLGFGNMYVHIFTFLLLCVAPFWIFNISALKIHNYVMGDIVGIAGILLCIFGLLYGGYWRIQMRKKFKLPGSTFCCGSASLTDYLQWIFCWSCSLAQEVRTGNFYDIEDDSFYSKLLGSDGESNLALNPNDNDSGSNPIMVVDTPNRIVKEEHSSNPDCLLIETKEMDSKLAVEVVITPPVQPLIQLEDRINVGENACTTT